MFCVPSARFVCAVLALCLVVDERAGSDSSREAFTPVRSISSDLELREVSLSREPHSAQLHVSAHIYNGSTRYVATTVELRFVRRDCVYFDCEVTGEKVETLSVSIPSDQEQAVEEYVDVSNISADGQEMWICCITSAWGVRINGERSERN